MCNFSLSIYHLHFDVKIQTCYLLLHSTTYQIEHVFGRVLLELDVYDISEKFKEVLEASVLVGKRFSPWARIRAILSRRDIILTTKENLISDMERYQSWRRNIRCCSENFFMFLMLFYICIMVSLIHNNNNNKDHYHIEL